MHAYLYDISAGCPTVHVLIILRDLNAVDNTFELTKIAVRGGDLSSLNVQLPHSQCQAKLM